MSPIAVTAAALAALGAVVSAAPAPEAAPSAPANASDSAFPELAHFFSNNTQWAQHKAQEDSSFFPTLNASQHPGIVWIGCSDSRVPESVVTQQNPGSIFTHVSDHRVTSSRLLHVPREGGGAGVPPGRRRLCATPSGPLSQSAESGPKRARCQRLET